jgi:hypothetical protein
MAGNGWRMTFRRWLDERGQTQLRRLRDMLTSWALSEEKDGSKWSSEKSGKFTVNLCTTDFIVRRPTTQIANCGKLRFH